MVWRQVCGDNPFGYPDRGQTRKQTFRAWLYEQKAQHMEKVVLCRVGEFYETYGLDAVLLVQHCGLNPMAGDLKAGCPLGNLRQTLDKLTAAGLSVAVFEEEDGRLSRGPSIHYHAPLYSLYRENH